MKKPNILFLSVIALLVFFTAPTLSQENGDDAKKVLSHPTHVTVYPDRALVTRSAAISLEKGVSSFVFYDLPLQIDPGSIQVSVLAENGGDLTSAQIFSQKTWKDYLTQRPPTDTSELEKRLEQLQKEKRALEYTRNNVRQKKKLLQSIQVKTINDLNKDLSRNEVDVTRWGDLLEFTYNNSQAIDKQELALTDKIDEVSDQIKQLQSQLRGGSQGSSKGVYRVKVSVESTQAAKARLEVQYITHQAMWEAEYDLRTSQGKTVELNYRARVRQNSGEDWDKVKLVLSTARPAMGLSPGVLNPLRVRIYQPPMRYGSGNGRSRGAAKPQSAPSMELDEMKAADAGPMAEPPPPPPPAAVQQEFASTTFQARQRANIPGTGSDVSVPLVKEELKANLQYRAIPALSEGVYISGKITNTLKYPLLPGKVSLYYGRRYTGSTQLRGVLPGESFELPLGVDQSIKVKRKKIRDYREDTGFIDKKKKMIYSYVIEVENLKSVPVVVEVIDRVPTSADEKIVVSRRKILPKDFTEDEKKPGILTWKLHLNPKEKQEITLEYSIEFPKEISVEQY